MYRKGLLLLCILFVLGFLPGTSAAQRGVPVTEKPRPDYDALGIRAGGFVVKPELTLGMEYNDNIYATRSSTKSDWITTIAPEVDISSNWNRHALGLNTGITAGLYSSESDENYVDGRVLLNGRLDVLRESFLMGNFAFQRLHEERGAPDAVAAWDEPAIFYSTSGDVAYYHGMGKVSVTAGAGFLNLDYQKVDLAAGGSDRLRDRDRNIYNVNARIAYELTPDVQPFLTTRYNWRRYDKADRNVNVRRDSEGYAIGAGTGFDLGGVTSGEIWAGYMQQNYDNLKNVSGFWYGTSLLWNVTEMTSVQAGIESSVKETATTGASGIDGVDANLRIDHELLRNLLVGAFLNYTHDTYKGINRTDQYFTVGPRVTYLWNRNLSAEMAYSHRQRDSNRADDFEQNRFSVALTGKF